MKKLTALVALCLCLAVTACAPEDAPVMGVPEEKTVYLTFDDVPYAYTEDILNILDDYGVKGTFFMLGVYMQTRPEAAKAVAARGHALGLHGLTHKKEQIYYDEYSPLFEMNDTQNILYELTGQTTKIIRLPWGSNNLSGAQRARLTEAGYLIWDWNVDTGDALGGDVPKDKVVSAAIEGIERYDRPVILMHNMKATRDALPEILDYIKEHGYATDVLPPQDNFTLK